MDDEACGAASVQLREHAPAAWRQLCGGHWALDSVVDRVRLEEVLREEEAAAEELDSGWIEEGSETAAGSKHAEDKRKIDATAVGEEREGVTTEVVEEAAEDFEVAVGEEKEEAAAGTTPLFLIGVN